MGQVASICVLMTAYRVLEGSRDVFFGATLAMTPRDPGRMVAASGAHLATTGCSLPSGKRLRR